MSAIYRVLDEIQHFASSEGGPFAIPCHRPALSWQKNGTSHTGCPKKMRQWFSSHYWHKYFTHMKNKDRYGILIISAFHAIFCFYPTPFQSLEIVRQSTSPPKSNTLFWSTAYVHNACVMCWIQLSWKLRGWFIDKWGPLKQINKGVGSHKD